MINPRIEFSFWKVCIWQFSKLGLRCSFSIQASLRFWCTYTVHIIKGGIYWLIFTETLERLIKVPSLPIPQTPAPTCPALENTTILKELFFTSAYWFHLIFIMSLMIDTVNFAVLYVYWILSFIPLITCIIVIRTEMPFLRHFILNYNYPDIWLLMALNPNYFKMKTLFINLEPVLHVFTESRWDNIIKFIIYSRAHFLEADLTAQLLSISLSNLINIW